MAEEQVQNPINSLLAEFGTRQNEIEEKQRLVRDRALLIGENLISTKEESEKKDFTITRKQVKIASTNRKKTAKPKTSVKKILKKIEKAAPKSTTFNHLYGQ